MHHYYMEAYNTHMYQYLHDSMWIENDLTIARFEIMTFQPNFNFGEGECIY